VTEISKLNTKQLGELAFSLVKQKFSEQGFTVEGLTNGRRAIQRMVVRKGQFSLNIYVRSLLRSSYSFILKKDLHLAKDQYVMLAVFGTDGNADYYLIPSLTWQTPNTLFPSRDYPGKKSKPEYGISLSQKNQALLDRYQFDQVISVCKG
jgi:hypothetical protein